MISLNPFAVGLRADREIGGAGIEVSSPLWFRRLLDFLFGRGQRHQAAAPSVDEPSELDRIGIHEAGHCIVARLFGVPVHFATTIPDAKLGFGGRAMIGFGPPVNRTTGDNYLTVDEIARTVDQHMPRPGEDRGWAAEWYAAVHENVVELLAGAAAEAVAFGRANDRTSRSDYAKAQRYARTICTSHASAEKYLEFALFEAAELIESYRTVLLALADELVKKRELDGSEVDQIISAALVALDRDRELSRRAGWHEVAERAQAFRTQTTKAGQ
jgi:hypothetical protein